MGRKVNPRYFAPWMWKRDKQRAKVAALRARDGDDCWRCHQPLDFAAAPNSKRAPTIEHLHALANGGTGKLDNLVLCHPGCNRHLGVNTLAQKLRMRLRKELGPGSNPG